MFESAPCCAVFERPDLLYSTQQLLACLEQPQGSEPHSTLLALTVAKKHTFIIVQWEIKTKQFLAGLRPLHPGARLR